MHVQDVTVSLNGRQYSGVFPLCVERNATVIAKFQAVLSGLTSGSQKLGEAFAVEHVYVQDIGAMTKLQLRCSVLGVFCVVTVRESNITHLDLILKGIREGIDKWTQSERKGSVKL